MRPVCLLLTILAVINASRSHAQQSNNQSPDEAAIRKMVASYVQAFNKHDAKALADHWSPDAVYLNRTTGEEVVGRTAITAQFAALFKEQPQLELEVNVDSIQFISPNVAVEHGTTTFRAPNAEPEEIEYTAVEVKREGQWLLDRVTDKAKEVVPSHYEQLKVLEWMIGEWTSDADNAQVELDCNWTRNQNFMTRAFKV